MPEFYVPVQMRLEADSPEEAFDKVHAQLKEAGFDVLEQQGGDVVDEEGQPVLSYEGSTDEGWEEKILDAQNAAAEKGEDEEELIGQEIEDMEGDRSIITGWNPETGRYTTNRGWTYRPGEFTLTTEEA